MLLKFRRLIWGLFCSLSLLLLTAIILFTPKTLREARLYEARTTYRTDFIIDNLTDTLFIVSTHPNQPEEITRRAQTRYDDYMGRRNISHIKLIDSADFTSSGFSYQRNLLRWGNKRIGIFLKEKPIHSKIDYAVVCRGYKDNISDIISLCKPDSIILAYDLDKRRLDRYEAECQLLNRPYINLRSRQWNLPFPQSD